MNEIVLHALRRGDEGAYRSMVAEYHPTLYRLARIYSPSAAIAEQTVLETWRAVLRGLDGYTGQPSPRTWICGVLLDIARQRAGLGPRDTSGARHAVTLDASGEFHAVPPDLFRSTGPYAGYWYDHRAEWWRLPEERLLSPELQDVVSTAIEELPRVQREVVTLRDIEGWSAAEVFDLLEIPDGVQRVLLHRARSHVCLALHDHLVPPVAS